MATETFSRMPGRLWRWWTGELSSMWPAGQGSAMSAKASLVVSAHGKELRFVDERPRRARRAPPAAIVGDDALDALLLAARERPPAPVCLRLPLSACYIRRVDVPVGLRRDIKRFLDLDLERATPFRLKDVYCAHTIDAQSARPGMLAVNHIIVRRDAVDAPLALVERTGAKVAAVGIWNETETAALPVDLLPKEDAVPSQAGRRVTPQRLMMILIGALAVAALYQDYTRHEQALASLTADTEAARAKALSVQQTRDAAAEALKEVRAVERLRAGTKPAAEVLETLTRLLPDTVWLTDLRIDGTSLQIAGEANEAASLIGLMEGSAEFSDAAFQSPVTRDATDDKERFTLRARIGKGEPPAAATSVEAQP
jgi:general secretion pathway protein L